MRERQSTDRADLDTVTKTLRTAGWSVTLSEMGYAPKEHMELPEEQRAEVAEFLEALDDNAFDYRACLSEARPVLEVLRP